MYTVRDFQGRKVDYRPKKYQSLLGKPLPSLEDFGVKLSEVKKSSKVIFICFFGMEQRPSRNCLQQLAKRAQELKAKDIVVVAVQASKIDENALKEWISNYNIPFPVGMNKGDEEEIRFTWGVRSLPWLILTDTNQIVRAEGFGMQNLDAKLKQISGD